MNDLNDKVAVVTGAGSGIGRGIALTLARFGVDLVCADIDAGAAQAVAVEVEGEGRRALAVTCDVSSLAEVQRLAEQSWDEFGHVDLLFNNAGASCGKPLLAATEADFRWLFEVNVLGVWNGCKAFGPRMVEQATPAHICNTGSEHSIGRPHIGAGMYTATKHAVLGMSDVLRRELPEHIGVSVLCPGLVDTAFWNATRNRPERFGGPEQGPDMVKAMLARGKDPLEIGRICVEGVRRGDFLIFPHPHSRAYAERRAKEVADAFDAQGPLTEDEKRYDIGNVLREMQKQEGR